MAVTLPVARSLEITHQELDLTGHQLIWNARARQKQEYSAKQDDGYVSGTLVMAAMHLAAPSEDLEIAVLSHSNGVWHCNKDQKNRIQQLAEAGALLAAEIDRIRRAEKAARKARATAVTQ